MDNLDKELITNASKGHLPNVKLLLKQGANINCYMFIDVDGYGSQYLCALSTSVYYGHVDLVKYLVKHGANIHNNSADAFLASIGHNIYYYSGRPRYKSRIDIMKFLLENGANINVDEGTALRYACSQGDLELVKFLVENGANVNIPFFNKYNSHNNNKGNYNSPLSTAAFWGKLDVIKYLMEQGADIHAAHEHALCNAASRGHLDVVKYLVELGADIHVDNEDPLRCSALFKKLNVMKYLIKKGANVNACEESDGSSYYPHYCNALNWAIYGGDIEVVQYLVEHGADIHANNEDALISCIDDCHHESDCYVETDGDCHYEIMKYLLNIGADIHARDDYALRWFAHNGENSNVEYLIGMGADTSVLNVDHDEYDHDVYLY